MNDLHPEDRALLDLAREGYEPTDEDRGRVRVALALRLGVGTGLAGATATTSKAATAFAATKVLAAMAIAGAIGAAGTAAYRVTKATPQPVVAPTGARVSEEKAAAPTSVPSLVDSRESPPSEAIQHDTRPTGAVAIVPKRAWPMNDSTPARAPAPVPQVSASRSAPVAPPPSPVATATVIDALGRGPQQAPLASSEPIARDLPRALPPPTTLEAETKLIRAGVAALHRGDAAGALALFDEHARTFPNGALAEERAAERVIALASLHRCEQARSAAAEFLRNHPHSPLAARVREPCVPVSNP